MNDNNNYPPLRRQKLTALGIDTSYCTAGEMSNPPIVLLHGMSASADSYREIMHDLAGDFYLIAPDIPGFGYSETMAPYTFPRLVDWLAAFHGELDLQPVHIAGHSFGGALGIAYALTPTEQVNSLILLAPSVLRPGKYPDWLRSLSKSVLAEKAFELGVSASRLMLQRQMRAAFHDPSRFPQTLWERRAEDYNRARASAAVLRASALYDIRSGLDRVQQPTCIIWGEDDPVLDPADAVQLAEMMPESHTTLHMLADCGHIPHIEQQEAVERIVHDFLETV